ncbi:MAG: type VI secretion system tip protein TssI/VgrG [Planctomycetota bacterium]|nr:type VI secretion system tip protein TssI/VgrG [Planctomycetota bacterium]
MLKRLLELEPTGLFGEKAILTSFSGREEISKPFEFSLTISSPKENIKPEDVIGKPIAVRVDRDKGEPRYFHGYISHFWAGDFTAAESDKGLLSRNYRVRIVPWIWFMGRAARCFVYLPEKQEKTILEVFNKLLERVKSYGHVESWNDLTNAAILKTRKVEHCVQYRETDLNFLSRSLERYGVYYYFKHEKDKHTLVLSDKSNYVNCVESEIEYAPSMGGQMNHDRIDSWEHAYEFVSGEWDQVDYDFQKPSNDLKVSAKKHVLISLPNNAGYELYENPNDYVQKEDGRTEATRRLESEEVRFNTVVGSSTCKTMTSGFAFKLSKHHNLKVEQGKSYLLTSVSHFATQPGPYTGSTVPASYSNQFVCVPREMQYRPARQTPSPFLASIQTAVVVGPKGEEIYTDEYGRVKVQFYWDREGKRDQNTSCWIRCQQNIAGRSWGFMALPRVGQEVVVDFIEGDPDRPLITGCVYNGEQMPHYKLPDEKTKTYIKTNSSKGGEGHNELMFEDKAKEERVYIHAQKDMDVRVLNDSKERIFGNRHQVIGSEKDGEKAGGQRELIYGDKNLNVKRHQVDHIEGNMQMLIGEGEAQEGGNLDLIIEKQKSEHVKGDSHLIINGNYNQKIDGGVSETIGGDSQSKVSGNIAQEAGAMGEIHLKAGMKIIIEAGMQLSLVGPGGFIDIGPAGVTIQGIMVNINSGGSKGSGKGCKPEKAKEAKKAAPAKPEIAHNSTSGSKSSPG